MKINHLSIAGFLSYQQKVKIDFTQFDLACITGENGAGKSSILDALTWALFGKARQSNESLINLQSDEAVVSLSFEYSGENYKIKRSNKRGKAARLTLKTPEVDLTERTIRDTQIKIESILKIDYETFTHAVFFLQGESDQFVTASPGQRKQVLFDILGLDAWETFRLSAAAKIKGIEQKMEQSRGSVQVLEEDIQNEDELKSELEQAKQGAKVANVNEIASQHSLDEEQKTLDEVTNWKEGQEELNKSFTEASNRVTDLTNRKTLLDTQQVENQALTSRKEQIVKDYERSRELTELLGDYGTKEIEHGKLQHALSSLDQQLIKASNDLLDIPELENSTENLKKRLEEAKKAEIAVTEIKENQTKWNADIFNYEQRGRELLEQIEGLEGRSICPLCEQKLKDPVSLSEIIEEERKKIESKTIQLQENLAESEGIRIGFGDMLKQIGPDQNQITINEQLILSIQKAHEEFDLEEIHNLEEKIKLLNYDKDTEASLKEEAGMIWDAPRDHGLLEGAEKIGDSLTVQIRGLGQDIFDTEATVIEYKSQIENNKDKYTGAYEQERLAAVRLYSENLKTAKADYERQIKREGQVEARLQNIETLKTRLKEIKENEKENTELHQKYCILQEAFSKKGVPALLVEQSLPQIESKANQLLHRLSDGQMAVHFITQKAYSDAAREDMKETLDIQIQDEAGIRDYEMYSGGESFRINFAIRMALSHVLANRAGAKLRTLIIDEGFGSQDAGGRDRLINAINIIKVEFDKVLVISHIQEVIESFPVQLRVEKTSSGSQVRVL